MRLTWDADSAGNNRLESLPAAIGALVHLKELNISNNNIVSAVSLSGMLIRLELSPGNYHGTRPGTICSASQQVDNTPGGEG